MTRRTQIQAACTVGALLALAGCAADDAHRRVVDRPGTLPPVMPLPTFESDRPQEVVLSPYTRPSRPRVAPQTLELPSFETSAGAGNGPAPVRDLDVTLNFKAAPLGEVVREIFENILKLDYAISPDVSERLVTFTLDGRVSSEELFRTLDTVLRLHGAGLTVSRDGLVQVLTAEQTRLGVGTPVIPLDEIGSALPSTATFVVPLQNIASADAQKVVDALVSQRGRSIEVANARALVIVESPENAERIAAVLRELDKPFFVGRTVRIYTPTYITPAELLSGLNTYAQAAGVPTNSPSAPIIPAALERAGQVLVSIRGAGVVERVDRWVEQLDRPYDRDELHHFVYNAQQRDAASLREVILANFDYLPEADRPVVTVLAGTRTASITSPTTQETPSDRGRAETRSPGATTTSSSSLGGTGGGFSGGGTTGERGTLIIRAKREVYNKIRELIDLLDRPPQQVILQVVVAEVTITGDVQFGVELFTRQESGGTEYEFRTGNNLVDLATGSAFVLSDNAFALVEAAETRGKVTVVDAPFIYAVSGQAAQLNVGIDQPVITQFIQGGLDTIDPTRQSNQVEYRQTGVVLDVEPVINDRGEISLKVRQEVSSIQQPAASAAIQSPAFPNRILQTTVIIPNGQTIVLGGTRSERDSDTRRRTPLLADIPLVGLAFQGKDVQREQNELVILITPTIVPRPMDAVIVSEQILANVINLDKIDRILQKEEPDTNEMFWR